MAKRRLRKYRKNPMPLSGALYLTNPKRKKAKKSRKAKSRKASALSRVIAKLNGMKRRRARKSKSYKRNGLAAATINGLALRRNRKHARKAKRNGLAFRRNGLAFRKNGLALRMNRKHHRKHSRKHHRKAKRNGLALRANGLSMLAPVQRIVAKVPVIGKPISGYVMPVALGAASLAGVHFALKYGMPYVPAAIADRIAPVEYTAGGVVVGAVVQFVPGLKPADKKALQAAAVLGGAAVDLFRYFSGQSDLGAHSFGDGGAWQLAGDDLGADVAAISADYSDASAVDAAQSGEDLDVQEGQAAVRGASMWRRMFPCAGSMGRSSGASSRHAGRHGHRWAWLIKAIGWDNFRKIAALPKAQRVKFLSELRAMAIEKAQAALAAGSASSLPDMGGEYGAVLYAGAAF